MSCEQIETSDLTARPWWKHPAALVAFAILLRYVCHSIMLLMALVAERRPAPTLPDAILSVLPKIAWVDRNNYHIWVLCYLPPAIALGFTDLRLFLRFLVAGGVVSLFRGACILMTGLGPVSGPDINAHLPWDQLLEAWVRLINPFSALMGGAARVHLTKDLFYSGHTATTFLLLLYCYRFPRLRVWSFVGHLLVVATVFLSHLHYTIDVVGAYAIAFSVYAIAEWWPQIRKSPKRALVMKETS